MRTAFVSLASAAVLLTAAAPAGAKVVTFDRNEGSYLADGRVGCVMGVNGRGAGMVTCAGPPVYAALWAGAPCDRRTKLGCVDDRDGIRSIGLRERGRSIRDSINGVGGAKDADRGDVIVLGGIRGRHLADGGFSFRNRSGHGFTITEDRLRRF